MQFCFALCNSFSKSDGVYKGPVINYGEGEGGYKTVGGGGAREVLSLRNGGGGGIDCVPYPFPWLVVMATLRQTNH